MVHCSSSVVVLLLVYVIQTKVLVIVGFWIWDNLLNCLVKTPVDSELETLWNYKGFICSYCVYLRSFSNKVCLWAFPCSTKSRFGMFSSCVVLNSIHKKMWTHYNLHVEFLILLAEISSVAEQVCSSWNLRNSSMMHDNSIVIHK